MSSQQDLFSEGAYNFNNVSIKGSEKHNIYLSYLQELSVVNKEREALFKEKLRWYGYNDDNTKGEKGTISEGIKIAEKENKNASDKINLVFKFIKDNAANEIGLKRSTQFG